MKHPNFHARYRSQSTLNYATNYTRQGFVSHDQRAISSQLLWDAA